MTLASISVIIPVYNGERYLAETIDSVLAQTCLPSEIIVVDDGSTDATAAVGKRYASQLSYDRQPHRGLAVTLNRGIQLARCDLLAFLDADDLWLPTKLEKQVAGLQADSRIDGAFCHLINFLSPDVDGTTRQRLRVPVEPQAGIFKSAMLIRRESFMRVGLFDETIHMGDFVDWYAKAQELKLVMTMLPEVLVRRRVHGNNMSLQGRPQATDYVRIAKAALDRRRKNSEP
jgi:glycosyltransferase involved in cell wall biosynthesis